MTGRRKWILAGAGLATALLTLAAPWTLASARLRREIVADLAGKTGLIASVGGRMALTLAPWPTVKIDDVALRDTGGHFSLVARALKGRVRLLPLIAARLEFSRLDFINATIEADANLIEAAALQAPAASSGDWTHPGAIDLLASSLRLRRKGRPDVRIENLDATLDWRPGPSSAAISAQGLLNGSSFDAALWLGQPDALTRGKDSAFTLDIGGNLLTASLNGHGQLGSRPQAEGKLAISAPSLREALEAAGWANDVPDIAGKFSATGKLKLSANTLSLSEARLSLDGSALEGGVSLTRSDPRPLLSATLAADRLQLDTFLNVLPRPFVTEFGWSRDPLPKPGLADIDLDLRLSAGRARTRTLLLEDAGFAVKTGDGKADITLVDSRAYNGHLKGRLVAVARPKGLTGKLNLNFVHVDAAGLLSGPTGESPILGDATGQISLEAAGGTMADLAQTLQGRIDASILNGDLIGIDVDQALRRSEKRPLSAASEFRRGRTSFAKADFSASIEGGKGQIINAAATGYGVTSAVSGGFAVPERRLALRLSSRQANADGAPKPEGAQLNVTIAGTFEDPDFDLDYESLIRRSRAAAPLLDAVKRASQPTAEP